MEGFDVRQPQHIALAGALGMGYFDFKSNKGRRFSVNTGGERLTRPPDSSAETVRRSCSRSVIPGSVFFLDRDLENHI